MKSVLNKITVLVFCAVLLGLVSCDKGDTQKEWGNAKIYMPQATMLDGGITNNYPVPLNNNPATKNYDIDSTANLLHIYLGVYRSGLQPLSAYSVKIYVDDAATANAIAGMSNGVALPSDIYSLPTEADVPDNERQTDFVLTVDLNKLKTEYMAYASKKLALVVGISDPSAYELNENLSKTTVIIDGPSFLPAPKIVQGGDFSDGSENYWTIMNLNNDGVFDPSNVVVKNGILTLTFGAGPVTGNIACYQPIELTKDANYKLSCDFTCSGGAVSGQFFICISTVEPQEGQYYDVTQGIFTNIDAWASNGLTGAVSGTLPQVDTWNGGIDKTTGVFTSTFSGTGYLIMNIACWDGNVGVITVDNLTINAM